MTKKIVTVCDREMHPYDIEGSLKDALALIKDLIEEYGEDTKLNWNPYNHYPYDSEPTPIFEILINREETDEEYSKRLEQEAKYKAAQEARDRAAYEELKKKYG